MKHLTLIRHAKSDQSLGLSDLDRPLNKRGQRDAPVMGKHLDGESIAWDWVYVSQAKRAQMTAELLLPAANHPAAKVTTDPGLYTFDADRLFAFAEACSDDYERIALVGHNPAITELTDYLCNAGIANVPTCGVIHIRADIQQWVDIDRDNCELVASFFPKTISLSAANT